MRLDLLLLGTKSSLMMTPDVLGHFMGTTELSVTDNSDGICHKHECPVKSLLSGSINL